MKFSKYFEAIIEKLDMRHTPAKAKDVAVNKNPSLSGFGFIMNQTN